MSTLNHNIDGQLANQLQKLVEEISNLDERLDKASKARERKKLQKLLDEKKALYKSLTESSAQQENAPATEETPAPATEETPASTDEETPKAEDTPAPAPEAPEATPEAEAPKAPKDKAYKEAPKAPKDKAYKEAPKAEAPKAEAPKTQTPAPKVSAKDTAPAPKLDDIAQDKEEDSEPPKWYTIIAGAVLAVVLGSVAWWYFYKDTDAVAKTVVYERATAQLKEDIQPAWWRWRSWDLAVKGEAILAWMPAYKDVYVDSGFTSTKGEATLYAVGCAIRALTKKGLPVGAAAEKVDSMSYAQLKAVLDNDTTLEASEVRAIKRALDN